MGEFLKKIFSKNLLDHEIYGPLEYKILFEQNFVKPSPTHEPPTYEMYNPSVVCSSKHFSNLHHLENFQLIR